MPILGRLPVEGQKCRHNWYVELLEDFSTSSLMGNAQVLVSGLLCMFNLHYQVGIKIYRLAFSD